MSMSRIKKELLNGPLPPAAIASSSVLPVSGGSQTSAPQDTSDSYASGFDLDDIALAEAAAMEAATDSRADPAVAPTRPAASSAAGQESSGQQPAASVSIALS